MKPRAWRIIRDPFGRVVGAEPRVKLSLCQRGIHEVEELTDPACVSCGAVLNRTVGEPIDVPLLRG